MVLARVADVVLTLMVIFLGGAKLLFEKGVEKTGWVFLCVTDVDDDIYRQTNHVF